MATEQEIQDRIDEIDEHLSTGMTSHNVDGVSLTFDLNELRKERSRLVKQLEEIQTGEAVPRNSSIDISGAFG